MRKMYATRRSARPVCFSWWILAAIVTVNLVVFQFTGHTAVFAYQGSLLPTRSSFHYNVAGTSTLHLTPKCCTTYNDGETKISRNVNMGLATASLLRHQQVGFRARNMHLTANQLVKLYAQQAPAVLNDDQPQSDDESKQTPLSKIRTKARNLTGMSLTSMRTAARTMTGFSLTALRTSLRAAVGRQISGVLHWFLSVFPIWVRLVVDDDFVHLVCLPFFL